MTKKQKAKLDVEEQATLDAFKKAFTKGKIKSIPHVKEKIEHFKKIAKASNKKLLLNYNKNVRKHTVNPDERDQITNKRLIPNYKAEPIYMRQRLKDSYC